MSERKREKMTPAVTMRIVFALSLVLILVGMGGIVYFGYTMLQGTAEEVSKIQTEAKAVDAKVQNLARLEKEMEKYKDSVAKARQLVAETQQYQYQNQIINDLTTYANQSGVGIAGFTFTSGSAGAKSNSGSSGTSGTNNSSGSNSAAGPKSMKVSVRLNEKTDYMALLRFMHLIEQNLTRMQIASVSMSKAEGVGQVSTQTLDVEVYVR
ncbi:hypothetical protein [Candidatus Nanosynbacter lyticus]|uniref:hypothetical protein n=1 Tax=Candidatus Nanosynbacter lyticus TaxID=2093824 RepID=UPI00148AF697|nr:hypothetical protein [Candidatus Nanosynbacter lyticus]QJU05279.1 hypothetical protein FBF32_03530 [Candidatus Saccharibacteria bacterium oral taxon 488]QJU10376.1 hypothetical protein FBF26_03880 [Candidatus Saccharibacteria bacterium oral taxon 488]WLD47074.1 hypothetical protein NLML1_0718 [Candidatus Nanosynbacter lyticus]